MSSMSNGQVARWAGAAGIAGTVLQVGAFGVFLKGAGSPANTEATLTPFLHSGSTALQTSFLLFFVGLAVWFLFFTGLRTLLAGADPGLDVLGTTVFGLGAAIAVLAFVFLGLEAAATAHALNRPDNHPDNAVIYALFMGGSVLDGVPVAVLVAALLAVAGWALSRSRLLPRWTVWLSWITALLVVATFPALYGGDDLGGIYSADGLVVEVLAFLPLYIWTFAVSIAILRMRVVHKPAAR
jgi:hypothetical protein